MTTERRQSRSTHSFIAWYQGKTPKDNVTVILEIDYNNKTYSITPPNYNHFTFSNCNKQSAMWLAVLEAIKAAVEYAEQDLFGPQCA